MRRSTPKDELDRALELVRAFGSRKGIPWLPGALDTTPESVPTIRYSPDGISGTSTSTSLDAIGAFLDRLEHMDVAMLITDVGSVTEGMWQDAMSTYEIALAEIESSNTEARPNADNAAYLQSKEELTELLHEAKAAKPFVGAVGTLDVWAITRHPTTMINCYEATEWWDVIYEADTNSNRIVETLQDAAEDAVDDSPAQIAAQREFDAMAEQRRFWTPDKRKDTARQLAAHPDFGRCKTESDKVYLLESIIGDVPAHDVMKKEIARAAGAVYKFEVASKKD
jgi:hypothetical protein